MPSVRKLRVFLSSPSDVFAERDVAIEVLRRLERRPGYRDGFHFEILDYRERTPAAVGESPQSTVDRYMGRAAEADIVVCLLALRMGTPVIDLATGERYASGTEYEFRTAYTAKQQGDGPLILVYRGLRPLDPKGDLEQAAAAQRFFAQFEGPDARVDGNVRGC